MRRPVKPPTEDDSTYLTVVHPYPLNANLQLSTDRRALALWLACCTGKPDVLRAMFHKPKAAGMVIIEVDCEFDGFNALLGMHSWSEFLLAPTEEEAEAGNSSRVFYCTYHNAEAIRKAGWNRVEIEDHWFQKWRLDNDRVKHPYPKSTYCDVPPESKTEVPMCHRLPQRLFSITPSKQERPAPHINGFKEDNAPKDSTTAVAMMDIFGAAPKASSVESGATIGASTSGAIPVRDQSRANGEATIEDNPWDGYNTPRQDPPSKVKKRRGEEWICLQHGPMCNPGICTVRAQVERDERWQKEREERAENKRKWMERKERKARKRDMELATAEGHELPQRDEPARLVNVPRGPRSGSRTEGNGDGSHDQASSLRFRTESPDPPPPSQSPVSPGQDSEEECTQTVISTEGDGFPISADMGREHPIAEVQSSYAPAQACGIGATGKAGAVGDGDGDGMATGIRHKRTRERNKGKGKTEIALNGHYGRTAQSGGPESPPDFEKVSLPEAPGGSWCESSVAW